MSNEPWYDEPAAPEPLLSSGQAIAVILMAPLVFLWAADYYGVDALGWLLRAIGVAP